MAGLINTSTGLAFGTGLEFQQGLGGTGLNITTVFNPQTLFTGVTNGGWYKSTTSGNTGATWNDSSGLGNNLTQPTSANQFTLRAGINNITCYAPPTFVTDNSFLLPSISINRQSMSWWCICRFRAVGISATRAISSFGSGLTDAMTEITGDPTPAVVLRTFGTSKQLGTRAFTGLTVLTMAAGSSNLIATINGVSTTLSPYTAGTLTGGTLFRRTDGFSIQSEIYEYGLVDYQFSTVQTSQIAAYAASTYRVQPSYGNVSIEGDSLTEGAYATTTLGWASIVDNTLGATYRQSNMGQTGRTAQQAASSSDSVPRYSSAFTKNIAIIWLGTNDLAAGTSATTTLGYLQTWLAAQKAAGYQTLATTIIARGDAGWTGAMEAQRLLLNTAINALSASYVDGIVDLAALPGFQNPNDTTYYNADKIHLANGGCSLAASSFLASIQSL